MRIDLISEHASPLASIGGEQAGGQNVHVAALAVALAAQGARVRVHTRRDDPDLPRVVRMGAGVEVVHIDAGPPCPVPRDDLWPFMDQFAFELVREWTFDRPDVAHAHFWMSAAAALRARAATGVPVAVTFHALGAEKRREQRGHDTSPAERIAVEERTARAADLVVATTFAEARFHRARGVTSGHLAVIPCGVDLARFRPRPGPPEPPGFRVVTVSRLVERKGIGNVIEAIAQVPDASLVIAGGPDPAEIDDDPMIRRYRGLAADLGVLDRVEMLGALPRQAVSTVLRNAHVVACCPWYEPFGMVALEAMACGVPVVATAVGGLAETVVSAQTGLLVPPREPGAIAAALRQLRDQPRLVIEMGRRAAVRARSYGWWSVAAATRHGLHQIAHPVASSEVDVSA